MINAIGTTSSYFDIDQMRIQQELKKLGITPSGNPSADKVKLQQAKSELIEKIKNKQEGEQGQALQPPYIDITDSSEMQQRNQMEIQRLGAMNIAELNRLYFGI